MTTEPSQTAPTHRLKGPQTLEHEQKYERFIEKILEGEHFLDVAADPLIHVASGTAYGWFDRAVRTGRIDPEHSDIIAPKQRMTPIERESRKQFLRKLLLDGKDTVTAANIIGVAKGTAEKWRAELGLSVSRLDEERAALATDPIPYDKLSKDARRALEDFHFFREKGLGRTSPPWATEVANLLLADYRSPEDEYVVVNAPPGVGKTTLITHDFICWVIALERALGQQSSILLGHRAWSKATWYVNRLRMTLSHNPTLIRWYGRFRSLDKMASWSAEQLVVEPLDWKERTEKEPTVTAGSYDASLLSGRFKIVIWDDLIDKVNSDTAEQREKLVEWNNHMSESRLNAGGLYVISNARYGPEDLSYTVTQEVDIEEVDEETGNPRPLFKRYLYKAHYPETCDGENHTGPYPNGCLLDPSLVTWKRIRRQMSRSEQAFLLIYQQEDLDKIGGLAQKTWFTGGRDETGGISPGCFDYERSFGQLLYPLGSTATQAGRVPLVSAVSLDPSSSKYWGIGHWLGYEDHEHVLYRGARKRLAAPDILYIDELNPGSYVGILEEWWQASLSEGVPFTYLIVEVNAAQKWMLQYPFFTRWAGAREVSIIPHTTTINKTDRDRGVEMNRDLYRFGKCHLPMKGYEEELFSEQFRREACAWPDGQFSDLVMMHWFFTNRMDQLIAAETIWPSDGEARQLPAWANVQIPAWAQRVS